MKRLLAISLLAVLSCGGGETKSPSQQIAKNPISVRGWIAYFNDLHKGRHTGLAWSWFIDALALACIIFSLTGLFLLHLHSARRWSTWPLVGLGLVAPLIIMLLFLH